MTNFDYGAAPAAEVNPYKLWPTEGSMTALIDGDMLPYIVGYTTDEVRAFRAYTNAKFLYGKEPDHNDWAWIEVMLKQPYFRDKIEHLDTTLNYWVESAKADSALIYLTDSATNFRIDIAFSHKYKGERPKTKPPFFYELRHYLLVMHNAILSNGCEADDLMSIEQWRRANELGAEVGSANHRNFADSIIVSKDKDLMIVPGLHCNPDTGEIVWVDKLGWLSPKFVEKEAINYEQWPLFDKSEVNPKDSDVYQEGELYYLLDGTCQDTFTRGVNKGQGKFKRVANGFTTVETIDSLKGAGLKFFYSQLICGDSVDNYKGIPGAGPTLAYEALDGCKTEKELYEKVLSLYESKRCSGADYLWAENYRGGRAKMTPYMFMLEQGRLAWMQTEPNEIWRAKSYCPKGTDDVWQDN